MSILRSYMITEKKSVLILGASSDIGFEVMKKFMELDWHIYAHYSEGPKKISLLKKEYDDITLIKLNFLNYKNRNFQKLLKQKFNKNYDAVINLVGYVDNRTYENFDLKSTINSFLINSAIPMFIQKIAVAKMIRKKWGRILNCSSISVKYGGGKNSFNYALSKHCLEFIPNSYRQWAKKNVFVNNLRIGVTDTSIHKRMKKNMKQRLKLIPISRMAKPEEIADYITNLTTEKNSYMTGQTITVAGGE